MKLRIKGNSVRLRLTQPEVATLAANGVVEERTVFPAGGALVYRLVTDGDAREPGAGYKDGVIIVWIPAAAAARWARGSVVGLEFASPLNNGGELRVLVEKDFACLNPMRRESDEGAFPNPSKDNCSHGDE